ncbi:prefoldin subunit, putative [Eimeria brunetti]|uniref:Prefoldin subunit, putative n=1 Tax=Eimeria brunetti TaxID=51314 RepID=U6LAX6_9EIME|nr:prefoldin subunit, putative [Eimeria brunetti]
MASEIDVTEESQKRLCRFSYLSHCVGTMEERIQILKKKISTLHDANEEVDVSFCDDDLWIKVGESFYKQDSAAVQQQLMKTQEEHKKELEEIDSLLRQYKQEMNTLKAQLYAEFGDRVRLEK